MIRRLLLLMIGIFAVSCGGLMPPTSGTATRGNALISFVWPSRTRLIPIAANAIRITLRNSQNEYSQLVSRPDAVNSQTSTIEFPTVEAGSYTVIADAFPNTDGTGTIQATGTSSITVQAGQRAPFVVTMLSTVTRLDVTGEATRFVAQYGSYQAVAYDTNNVQVLVDPSVISWSVAGNYESTNSVGSSVRVKGLDSLGITVTATYEEPNTPKPTGSVSVDVWDPIFVQGSSFQTASATGVSGFSVAGDSVLDQMLTGEDSGSLCSINPREFPGSASGLLTVNQASGPMVVDVNGVVYAVVDFSGVKRLYRGARGVTPTYAFDLPSTTMDLGVDGSGNVYTLYTNAGASKVRKFTSTGVGSDLTFTLEVGTTQMAVDQYGSVFAGKDTISVLRPNGSTATVVTHGQTLYDLAAADDNVYLLLTPNTLSQAHIECLTSTGTNVFDAPTNAFFENTDQRIAFSIDPVSLDFYLLRAYEDFTFTNQYDVQALFIR